MTIRWVLLGALLVGCADDPSVAQPDRDRDPISHATVCGSASTVNGIDVSEYDTAVDWPTAKAAGIDFAFMRVSDGIAYPDSAFAGYWAGALAGGVIRGAYQYFRPDVDPVAQADLLATSMGTLLPGDLPPVLDLEVADGVSTTGVVTAVNAWIAEVEAKTGRSPIIYAGLYSWPELTGGADETQYPLWIAQYTTAACPDIPAPWTQWQFWQHSDTGVVDGVTSSQLDLDVFSGTLAQLETFAAASGSGSGSAVAPCGVIDASGGMIDDSDACFTPGGPTAYMRHVTDAGEDDTLYWTHTTQAAEQANYGEWDLDFAAAGTYLVEAYTDTAYATSQAADYQIQANGQMQSSTIDQSAVDGWQSLGQIAFAAGGNQSIVLGDNTGEATQKQLVFDAVRFTPLAGSGSDTGSGSDNGGGTTPDAHVGSGCATTNAAGGSIIAFVLAFVLRRRRCDRSSSSSSR